MTTGKSNWRILECVVAAALATAIPTLAQETITYDVPGAVNGVFPNMVVPSGAITGGYLDANNFAHGFLRAPDGAITTFDVPGVGGSFGSTGQSMNEQGTIVGSYTDTKDRVHGFLRDSKGRFTTFDVPGSIRTVIRDVNPAGTIAGIYRDANNVRHAYLRTSNGKVTAFVSRGGGPGGQRNCPTTHSSLCRRRTAQGSGCERTLAFRSEFHTRESGRCRHRWIRCLDQQTPTRFRG